MAANPPSRINMQGLVPVVGSGYDSRQFLYPSIAPAVNYTPLFKENFSGGIVDDPYPTGTWADSVYTDEQSVTADRAMKLTVTQGRPPETCGGLNFFGGRITLPQVVTEGEEVWFALKMYFPSQFSWGYVFGAGDGTEAAECSKSADGDGNLKFIKLTPDVTTQRSYFQPLVSRRSIIRPTNTRVRLISDADNTPGDFTQEEGRLAIGSWQDVQFYAKVSKSAVDGRLAAWVGKHFIGELNTANIAATDTGLAEIGIGTYFNGIPFTDDILDLTRTFFYIDEIRVATSMAGFGVPNTLDSNGRPYISPYTKVSDLP